MGMISTREYSSVAEMREAYKQSYIALRGVAPNEQKNLNEASVQEAPARLPEDPILQHQIITKIKIAVCDEFDITVEELTGKSAAAIYVVPRHIAIVLCILKSGKGLKHIARVFGNRDHTSILYARNRLQPVIDELTDMPNNASFREWVVVMHWLSDRQNIYPAHGAAVKKANKAKALEEKRRRKAEEDGECE